MKAMTIRLLHQDWRIMERFQAMKYAPDSEGESWATIDGLVTGNLGECINRATEQFAISRPDAGILILDNDFQVWAAHLLFIESGQIEVVYNPEVVRMTRIAGNN